MIMSVADDLELVYRRHADELVRYATVLVGHDHAADLMIDAFLAATRSASWSKVREPRAYLFQTVLNHARMHHRKSSRAEAREYRAARLSPPSGVPSIELDLVRMLRSLSPQQCASQSCSADPTRRCA